MKILPPKSFISAAALCLSSVLSSCSPEGSYELFVTWTQLGMVQYTPDSSSWYILNDDNLKLLPKNAHEVKTAPEDSARVLIVFNVLADERVSGYDYVVTLAYITPIRVYDVAPSSAGAIADSSDKIRNVDDVWIGSHYLNVDYYFFYSADAGKHEVSLLRDTAAALQGNEVKLFLKHNSKGDSGTTPCQNIVSFDLKSLRGVVPSDTVSVSFEATCSDGTYQRSFSYVFSN
jgi:hypothetical protein